MTAEVRARTLTGRHQISDDGRRLVDGIPFGRPYLRQPNRPAVRIPPRKRQRLDDADEEVEVAGLLAESGEASPLQEGAIPLTVNHTAPRSTRRLGSRRASKSVRFKSPELDDDEDSDEDDEDFAPDGAQDEEVSVDADSDTTDTDSSDASDTSSSDSDDTSSDSDSDSDSDNESEASSPPEVMSSRGVLQPTPKKTLGSPQNVAPGQGRAATRARNGRRTKTNRLRFLKAAGKLPPDADLEAMAQYDATQNQEPLPELDPEAELEHEQSKSLDTSTGKRKRTAEEEVTEDTTELAQRKEELMARFGEAKDSTTVQAEESLQESAAVEQPLLPQVNAEEEQPTMKETPKKRLRPDTSAISRILARQAMVRRLQLTFGFSS